MAFPENFRVNTKHKSLERHSFKPVCSLSQIHFTSILILYYLPEMYEKFWNSDASIHLYNVYKHNLEHMLSKELLSFHLN